MGRRSLPVVLGVVGLLATTLERPEASAADDDLSRVMFSGDSLTQGASDDWTWRFHMWNHLEPSVDDLDFVGPDDDVLGGWPFGSEDSSYRDPDFDQDHNSAWGRSLEQAARTIGADVAEYQPDLLLVLLGTNDLAFRASPEDYEQSLRTYIADARAEVPDLHFAIGEVPPMEYMGIDGERERTLAEYNEVINEVAREESTPESPIAVVDIAGEHGFTAENDTYDGTHPNDEGEMRIAAAFADVLAAEFDLGEPYAGPYPQDGDLEEREDDGADVGEGRDEDTPSSPGPGCSAL
ncbi:GDSL family lipase [Spiractinospora alimapuensis]|uniref:GDSL-type esterase/lipase family protein n=1 Tax=Spiractinospora alimapuensis TaxID=2820884 RepID=UPI001F4644D0|nr:GDSL-type esterase/lipase family protein [Spiractinospora alimapuensis]QVQ53496.1 GDSL family lipase [Spiractinospora alimapuensis]